MKNPIIDYKSLTSTAKVLETINPGRSSAAHILDMIRANIREGESTYISTCGWIAFTWMDGEGRTNVRVAVEPYSVLAHLNKNLPVWTVLTDDQRAHHVYADSYDDAETMFEDQNKCPILGIYEGDLNRHEAYDLYLKENFGT